MESKKPRKLRVLGLHGYNHQGATIKSDHEETLLSTFADIVDFVFIDGTQVATDPPFKYQI